VVPSGIASSSPDSVCISTHEVVHLGQRGVGGLDDDVDAVTELVELVVGDERATSTRASA
jgi:hypothetical protein